MRSPQAKKTHNSGPETPPHATEISDSPRGLDSSHERGPHWQDEVILARRAAPRLDSAGGRFASWPHLRVET